MASRGSPAAAATALVAALVWGMPASAVAAVGFTAPANLLVGDSPQAMTAGDFNGDGDLDLAVVNNLSYTVSVLLGGPGGSFAPAESYSVGLYPQSIAAADFNDDADLDLAVVNGVESQLAGDVSILLGGTGGTFGTATSLPNFDGRRIAIGNFNGDLDPDLAVTIGNDGVQVRLGGAGAAFGSGTNFTVGDAPYPVAVGQFNGEVDTDPDLAVGNGGSDSVSVLLGTEPTGGSFGAATHLAVGDNPQGIAVADFNGGGDPDLAVANMWSRNVSILLGGAGGGFGAATEFEAGDGPRSIAVADFDGDGKLDLAVANAFEPTRGLSVLTGNGDGTFDAEQRFEVLNGAGAIVAGDFNADGDPDVALANTGSDRVSVLLNTAHRPGAPTLTASDPSSPVNNNAPKVMGQAEPGSTVRLYTSADCSGDPAATGTAAEFGSPGLSVSVPDDSTTTFRATATNAADVPSTCSSSTLTFVEHSSPPRAGLVASPHPALTGANISFDASGSSGFGISRYEWDLDGDGAFEIDTGANPTTARSYPTPASISAGVRVSNDLGSSVARAPLSIRLAPPPGALGASINAGARYTNDPDVSVSIVWPPLVSQVRISNDGGFANPGVSPVAPLKQWTLDSSGPERLPKTVYVRFDDSSQTFTDDIILDETAPSVTAATVGGASAARASAARVRSHRIRISARDATSGVSALQVTSNRRKPGKLTRFKRKARVTKTVRYRSRSARIHVRVRDAAGNYSRWRKARRRS